MKHHLDYFRYQLINHFLFLDLTDLTFLSIDNKNNSTEMKSIFIDLYHG